MARRSLSVLKNLTKSSTPFSLTPEPISHSFTYVPRVGDGDPRAVTLIPGDGTGPLITNAVEQVMDAMHTPIYFEKYDIHGHMKQVPQEVIDSIKKNRVCLKGGLITPMGGGLSSLNVQLRKELHLYASLVNCFNLPGLPTRHENVDIVVITENTVVDYSRLKCQVVSAHLETLKWGLDKQLNQFYGKTRGHAVYTWAPVIIALLGKIPGKILFSADHTDNEEIIKICSERIAKYAFEYAYLNNRKKVTAVHKANITADGLFLEYCREVATKYPGIKYNEIIMDNYFKQLIHKPQQLDVIVAPNIYGDLVAYTAAGITAGGTGVMPRGNVGAGYAVFEEGALKGDVGDEKILEQKKANPFGLLLSSAMMLRHLQFPSFADRLETAVKRVISEGKYRTKDLGGDSTTQEVVDAVIAYLD